MSSGLGARDLRPLIQRVYAYVAYRVGDGADAEDITSETFERAHRYRDSFDPRRGDATAWLIGIARRRIADAMGDRVEWTIDLPEQPVDDHVELVVEREDLRAALATLSERDRELIALRYGADLSARQIAELLNLKTNAVEVALHRALKTLRATLEDRAEPASPTPEMTWVTQPPT